MSGPIQRHVPGAGMQGHPGAQMRPAMAPMGGPMRQPNPMGGPRQMFQNPMAGHPGMFAARPPMKPMEAGPNKPPPASEPPKQKQPENVLDDPPKKKGGKECCKKVMKFLFSHIGLCGMVIAYSVAGGFIFEHLEKTNEQQECIKAEEKYRPSENSTVYKMWDVARNFPDEENVEEALTEYRKLIQRFRDDVLALGYDGKNCTMMGEEGGPGYEWSFSGALLFSVTVITTIGYGNIAPKTFWGRLVCIAYATLGIPLMLLCLANLGDVMADIFRFVYSRVCCCGCCRRKDKGRKKNEENTNNKSKDGDPENKNGGNEKKDETKDGKSPEAWKANYGKPAPGATNDPKNQPQVVEDNEDEEEEEEEEQKISVPLTITMGVITGYIFMGALLFGVWEGWDALDAAYFCFITISTIGFGDLVPGSANFEKAADQYKMILSSIYVLFGMAILSMCFSLIQEEIIAKFKWVGEKLGIVEKDKQPKDDEDEEDDEEEDKDKDRRGKDKKDDTTDPGSSKEKQRPTPVGAAPPPMGPPIRPPMGQPPRPIGPPFGGGMGNPMAPPSTHFPK